MNKICTSLEQSKKLMELGIDVNTADMCWTNHCYSAVRSSMTIAAKTFDEYKSLLDRFNDSASIDVFIPAWSLSALLELIPSNVFLYSRLVKWDNSYYMEKREMLYDNPVDAAFEMVCWLKENGKI